MNTEELIIKLANVIVYDIQQTGQNNSERIRKSIEYFLIHSRVTFTSTSKAHYQQIPGLQAWDFARSMPYNLGTAFCYLWGAGKKGDKKADLQKALDHLEHDDSMHVELPRDYAHLFDKYFPERISSVLQMIHEFESPESISSAKRLIQGEINET